MDKATTGRVRGGSALVAAAAAAAVLGACGPKTLDEVLVRPEVGYPAQCARLAAEQTKATEELRYFPPKLQVRAWPKPLAGGKEATMEDRELADRVVRGEARRLLVQARGGVGKSTLGKALEAMACDKIAVFRADLKKDVSDRLAAGQGGNGLLAAIERQAGVTANVTARERLHELVVAAPTVLLLDAIEEVPLADRPKVVEQMRALADQMPQMRMVVFARPAVFDHDYGLGPFDGIVEIATLDCTQAKAVLRWSAPDKDHQARADNFIRTYRLDQQATRADRCVYPYMTAYRDLQVVARMAEKFEPTAEEGGLTASLSEVHETIVGERLQKELGALQWSPGQVLQAIDRMVQVDGRDKGEWNLIFTVPRCLQAVSELAKGEVQQRYVCEKLLQSALFDRIQGAEEWRFDHQNVADLFLARWLDRELERFQGDCEVVERQAAWIGTRDVAGYLVGQPKGRACVPQVAAAICAARQETFERGMGDLIYKGLPVGKERRPLVEAARTAVSRWKKATPCVKTLVGGL